MTTPSQKVSDRRTMLLCIALAIATLIGCVHAPGQTWDGHCDPPPFGTVYLGTSIYYSTNGDPDPNHIIWVAQAYGTNDVSIPDNLPYRCNLFMAFNNTYTNGPFAGPLVFDTNVWNGSLQPPMPTGFIPRRHKK